MAVTTSVGGNIFAGTNVLHPFLVPKITLTPLGHSLFCFNDDIADHAGIENKPAARSDATAQDGAALGAQHPPLRVFVPPQAVGFGSLL